MYCMIFSLCITRGFSFKCQILLILQTTEQIPLLVYGGIHSQIKCRIHDGICLNGIIIAPIVVLYFLLANMTASVALMERRKLLAFHRCHQEFFLFHKNVTYHHILDV